MNTLFSRQSTTRKFVSSVLITAIFSIHVGCAGRQPMPVQRYQPGDEDRSCGSLETEVASINNQMPVKKKKADETAVWNLIWFAGGFFTIVTFFFIDAKDADKVEYNALKQRHNHLISIAKKKDCAFIDAIEVDPVE